MWIFLSFIFRYRIYCVQWQISGENPQGSMVSALEMLTNKSYLKLMQTSLSHNDDRSIAISKAVLKIEVNHKPHGFLPVRFS